jgi:hypothetical protein
MFSSGNKIITSFGHFVPARTAFAQTNKDFDAAVVQVLRMRMALAAVANDGHRLAFDQAQITVFVVENFHGVLNVMGWETGGR